MTVLRLGVDRAGAPGHHRRHHPHEGREGEYTDGNSGARATPRLRGWGQCSCQTAKSALRSMTSASMLKGMDWCDQAAGASLLRVRRLATSSSFDPSTR